MILWKSDFKYRNDDCVIIVDRNVICTAGLSVLKCHENHINGKWRSNFPDWQFGLDLSHWQFGLFRAFFDCEHNTLSLGPFFIYWSA